MVTMVYHGILVRIGCDTLQVPWFFRFYWYFGYFVDFFIVIYAEFLHFFIFIDIFLDFSLFIEVYHDM